MPNLMKRSDGYEIRPVAASPLSTEREWHRVIDPENRHVGTFCSRKAATDAISKDKQRSRR